MHTLVISASPWCQLEKARAYLQQAGMLAAKTAAGSSITSMSVWYDRLLAANPGSHSALQPGKPWELAAGEIFLANWEQPVWGWADSRSTWVLDFWRDFDPSTRFVLLHTPAYDVLVQAFLDTKQETFDAKGLLDIWCAYQTELLRFYHRNRERSVLAHAHQVFMQPAAWIKEINAALGTQLHLEDTTIEPPRLVDPLVHLLVKNLLQNNQAVQFLEEEISATLSESVNLVSAAAPDILAASASLRASYRRHSEQIHALDIQKAKLLTACEAEAKAKAEATAQRDAEAKAKAEAITQRDSAVQQHAKALKELQQENELLLLQLHQVQEELEQHFLTGQDLKAQLGTARDEQAKNASQMQVALNALQTQTDQLGQEKIKLVAENAALAKAKAEAITQRDAEAKAKAEAITQRDAEAKAKAEAITQRDSAVQQHAKALKELQQENELLLLQLHQVQEELEQHFLTGQDLKAQLGTARDEQAKNASQMQVALNALQTQIDQLGQEKIKLVAENAALAKAKAEATAQRDAEAKAKAEAITQRDSAVQQHAKALKELQQENELLLLQLHQVQEELEHYFLQHQQVTQEKQELNTRINKFAQRYPDYIEYDRVELVQENSKNAKKQQLHSQILGLKAAGRQTALIDLTLEVINNRCTLTVLPPAKPADSPLLYWPGKPAEDAAGTWPALQLEPTAANGSEAAHLLNSLAPSDLQLLRAACTAMAEGLPSTLPNHARWLQHLATLRQQLADLPPAWRFDTVRLKHQQVNPDYEHLWFELGNAKFGARQWPEFEFRLSAANIKKGKFSQHPKLEFPLPAKGAKQFENWFEESEDDRGAKFELRFDMKTQGLDINTWRTLSATDQAQALAISSQLPELLQRLQAQGTTIARPWTDWQSMAAAIQQAFSHCLGVAPQPVPRITTA